MDTQNVVCTTNGMLFSHKKEVLIHPVTDESWKHAKWSKPEIKGQILYDASTKYLD